MTFKRFAALLLSVLMLMTVAPELVPAAQAAPSTDGCTSSMAPGGKHVWGAGNYKEPWCTTPGGTTYRCRYCKKEVFEQSAPALGHNWSAWETVDEATCTEKGLRTRYCLRCYVDVEEEIPALGHYFPKPWTIAIAPTCEDAGQEVNYCVRCNYEWRRPLEAIGHDWDEGKVTKAPTATEDGEKTYTCLNDPSHTKTEVIPAMGETTTKPEDEKPELTITLWAEDLGAAKKTEFQYEKSVYFRGSVTNTGNVDIELYNNEMKLSGYYSNSTLETRYLMKPGETLSDGDGLWFLSLGISASSIHINPGTETETLAGTITYTATVPGYRPGTDEVICSDTASCTVSVLKPEDDGPHASLKYEITWDENAGEGKRYEGATVTAYCKTTNTGDCTVYPWPGLYSSFYHVSDAVFPSGTSWIEPIGKTAYTVDPGQSWTYTLNIPVRAKDVEQGFIDAMRNDWADYENPKGYVVSADNCEIHIPLTYPDGEEPEEEKPGLKIAWLHDEVRHKGGSWFNTTEPGVLGPEDDCDAYYSVTNTGNVPLKVVSYVTYGNGETGTTGYEENSSWFLTPGKTTHNTWGSSPITYLMTPGTETEDLLGTTTVSFYCVGYDPETYVSMANPGPALCSTETITRTWKVGKNSPWPIPEDSKLTGTLAVAPGYESSDPAGYQLGEEIETVLTVKNTGLIDLETYGVSDPYDSTTFTDGPIAVSEEKSYLRADVTVTEEDVERGYIEFPKITISWTDPDSEKERTAFAGPLTVTVLKKTGLLLKKGVAFGPEDGDYFKEGEPIQWSLTVTNNSKDSITNVTVEDKGKTVGSYAAIAPNDTKNCTVPVHIVTEYDAKVVGYVLNSATATGTDYRGAVHTWPSNVAKALTKKPAIPGEDPKGELDGLHPAITITKAEDPHGPLNGSYYEANEPIKYIVTIKNVGDTELKDIAVTDSLAGFAPIGTKDSLAPNEEKTFDFAYTVKEEDIPYCWIYNSATVTYTFGDGIKGTPKTSNTVQSRVGDEPFPPEFPHLDPGKLPEGDDWCRLTLDRLGDTKADYTLHACAEHLEAALAAEEAALRSDWTEAAALWRAEVEELYETLYEAADSELKAVLVGEKAAYFDYVDSLTALSAEATANELRMKCAFLCCALHTTPDDLASSLAGDYAQMMDAEEATASARIFAPLTGSDSAVTETYAGSIAYAQKNVLGLMDIEKSYNWDEVFTRGAQLWTSALDSEVNPVYKGANKETRKLIALWRISLDSLSAAERPFLELLYEGNDNAIEETLMNLYKDAALTVGELK